MQNPNEQEVEELARHLLGKRVDTMERARNCAEHIVRQGYNQALSEIGELPVKTSLELNEKEVEQFLQEQGEKGCDLKTNIDCRLLAKLICSKFSSPPIKTGVSVSVEQIEKVISDNMSYCPDIEKIATAIFALLNKGES